MMNIRFMDGFEDDIAMATYLLIANIDCQQFGQRVWCKTNRIEKVYFQ